MDNAKLWLKKKNSTPYWDAVRKAPDVCTSSPCRCPPDRPGLDVISKGDVAWRALSTGCPCWGLPDTCSHAQVAPSWGLWAQLSGMQGREPGRKGRVSFCCPHLPPTGSPLQECSGGWSTSAWVRGSHGRPNKGPSSSPLIPWLLSLACDPYPDWCFPSWPQPPGVGVI